MRFSDEELLADLRKVLKASGGHFSMIVYDEDGKFGAAIFRKRFGSWKEALVAAAINPSDVNHVSDEFLFQNFEEIWIKLGRQPEYDEVKAPLSQFSAAVYKSRFGTWTKALEKFVEFANRSGLESDIQDHEGQEGTYIRDHEGQDGTYHSDAQLLRVPQLSRFAFTARKQPLERYRFRTLANAEQAGQFKHSSQSENLAEIEPNESRQQRLFESLRSVPDSDRPQEVSRRTNRFPNHRLRWQVHKRDHFRCVSCGRSPAKDPNVELHVDHIKPWSKGGETVLENLQTLCATCNLGKSNIE